MRYCLFVMMCLMMACPKEPPAFEPEGGDNGGVETEAGPCADCEAQLQKALEDAAFYMELAENCVDNKVKVRKR